MNHSTYTILLQIVVKSIAFATGYQYREKMVCILFVG